MHQWIIMNCCLLVWQGGGMAQGQKRMPAEMAREVTELEAQAEALHSIGEYDAALEPSHEIPSIHELYEEADHPDIATWFDTLAMLHHAKGDHESALSLYERALIIRENALGPAHPLVASSLLNLALLHLDKEEYEQALPHLERALAILHETLGPAHPLVAATLNNLAMLHHVKGDHESALPLYSCHLRRALAAALESNPGIYKDGNFPNTMKSHARCLLKFAQYEFVGAITRK
jgi:tetratricopeptide (TPR) repeat protein